MSKFFRLFEECYLINASKNPSIYNTFTGKVYVVSEKEAKLLSLLEANASIENASHQLAIPLEEVSDYLKLYEITGLGTFYKRPHYVTKIAPNYGYEENFWAKPAPRLFKAFVSLAKTCTRNCTFCNLSTTFSAHDCLTCVGQEQKFKNTVMPIGIALQSLEVLAALHCRLIQFRVPEINDSNQSEIIEILKLAGTMNFAKMSILIGSGKCSHSTFEMLSSLGIRPIFQEVFNAPSDVEDFFQALIPYRNKELSFHCVLNGQKEKEIGKQLQKHVSKFPSTVFTATALLNEDSAVSTFERSEFNQSKKVPAVDVHAFGSNIVNNPCLGGTIYINQDGDVSPCPGLVDFRCGHISKIEDMFSPNSKSNLFSFWNLTKSKLPMCNVCGLKYACFDCRGLEYHISKELCNNTFCPLSMN